MRRLLENGANTSFVNRIADTSLPLDELVADPVTAVEKLAQQEGQTGLPHPKIPLHADGIRLFGASDTLVAALKKHKLPLVKTSTTNTLVFAVNTAEPLTKKLYLPSFLAPQAPWFSCFVGDAERPAEYSLHFAAEEDLVDFILSMYYCAQGFLHLDFDLAELVTKLNPSPEYVIHSFEEKDFHKIGED